MFDFLKKSANTYNENHGLMGNADDYNIYHMTCKDYIIGYLIGFVPGFVIIMIFFRIMVFSAIVGGFCGIPAIHLYRKYRKEKRKRDLLIEFRDLLEVLTTSYSSGKNTMEAFAESYQDLLSLYGEKSDIVNETRIIIAGMTNNIIIEDLLKDFAKRCGLDDVESFASTFESGLRQGGDIKQVVWDSRKIINDKIEIEMEIKTMLTEKENELNIMMVMPLVIMITLSGMGTMSAAANTAFSVMVKIFVIALFAGAYIMGRKIVNIRI